MNPYNNKDRFIFKMPTVSMYTPVNSDYLYK